MVHTQCVSPGGSTRCGQRTIFRPSIRRTDIIVCYNSRLSLILYCKLPFTYMVTNFTLNLYKMASLCYFFSALMLLTGCQEVHQAYKNSAATVAE